MEQDMCTHHKAYNFNPPITTFVRSKYDINISFLNYQISFTLELLYSKELAKKVRQETGLGNRGP